MQFVIDGHEREFQAIKAFITAHHLPNDFGVAFFEPKDTTGMGTIDRAGGAVKTLSERVLAAVQQISPPNKAAWLAHTQTIEQIYLRELRAINSQVGLRDPEIEFATSSFIDALTAGIYAAVRGQTDAAQIYTQWLNESVSLAQTVFELPHGGDVWQVQIISHVYGRIGLQVQTATETHYVADSTLACPAEGAMAKLILACLAHIMA